MLTVDDLAGLDLFADVPAAELDRLARAAADVHLAVGEFLVHEGDERALFVVVERPDRADQALRRRGAGHRRAAAGQDLRRGTDRLRHPVPGDRPRRRAVAGAADRRRRSLHARRRGLAEVRTEIGALALERLGGLQSFAAEPPKPQAIAARRPPGTRLPRAATLPVAQPDPVRLGDTSTLRISRPAGVGRRSAPATCRRSTAPTAPPLFRPEPRGWRAARAAAPPRTAPRTTRSSSAGAPPGWPPPSTAPPRGCRRWSSSARPPAARPRPRRGSRTTSAFRAASRETSSPAGRYGKRIASARRS